MRSTLHKGRRVTMSAFIAQRGLLSAAWLFLPLSLLSWAPCTQVAAQQSSAAPMRLTLDQAIDLALKQNHSVHLRSLSVEQMQSKKDEARSNYCLKSRRVVTHSI
jgi:outer membrane protein TolC